MPRQPSIRRKITVGYYAIAGIIVILSVFAFIELRFLEHKVLAREQITALFDTVLELRRFEKNYMLYRQDADLSESRHYVQRAEGMARDHAGELAAVIGPARVRRLATDLAGYRVLMERYALAVDPSLRGDLEHEIRALGKRITTVSEEIARTERRALQASLTQSMSTVLLSIVCLSLFGIALGRMLSARVVRPLKLLEDSMETVGQRPFKRLSLNSRDREIVSLTRAFNHMLHELELGQRHLIQSEKLAALGTLLSGVAHELNNPLSNISSSCQILLEKIEDGDIDYRRELLQQIDGQTERARHIVRSLLDFSRTKEFRKEPVALHELLSETLRFLRGQVPAGVSVTLDVTADLVVPADRQRLQQAFLNLMKNAIEAMGKEGRLALRAQRTAASDDHQDIASYLKCRGDCMLGEPTVDIEVTDTGPGIPADTQSRIFDPFFTTKDVGKGSGLGLYIVHEIVEEHGGCIAVQSRPGAGTTFLIRLPLKDAHAKI